jgi:EpsD family peptidyl-prolyl cis-trans isomerase
MKLSRTPLAVVSLACLAMAGCRLPWQTAPQKQGGPKGQVVAVVKGEEITLTDLRTELGNQTTMTPQDQKALEQAGLEQIIGRKLLANAAHDQGLDKTPDFAIQRRRATETVLAMTLQRKIAAQVPPPTRDEAERFVTDNPTMFAQRRFFVVDQIRMRRVPDVQKLKELEPLKTMEDVEAWLVKNHVDYERTMDSIDTLGTDARLIDFIDKLPPNEVFVVPRDNILLVNQIRETRSLPLTGDRAINYALDYLRNQRTLEAVARAENQILAKAATQIRYNDAYRPPGLNQTAAKGAPAKAAKGTAQ